MAPAMLCTTRIRVVSDGRTATVVVVTGATVVVVVELVVVVGRDVVGVDDGAAACDERVPFPPAKTAIATPATAIMHTPTTSAIRAPGRGGSRPGLMDRTYRLVPTCLVQAMRVANTTNRWSCVPIAWSNVPAQVTRVRCARPSFECSGL